MLAVYPLKLYMRHPFTAVSLGVGFFLNLVVWGWIAFQIPRGTEQIFLHYNVLFGVDTIGVWHELFVPPLGGLIIIIFNGLLGWIFFQRDKYLAHFLNATSVIVQIFLCAAAFVLVMLNA